MYRAVDTFTWIDDQVKDLPHITKLVWLYLITNDHSHASGLYYLPSVLAAEELRLTREQYESHFRVLAERCLCQFEASTSLVFICNMARHQIRSPNVVRSAVKHLLKFKKSRLVYLLLRHNIEMFERYLSDFGVTRESLETDSRLALRSATATATAERDTLMSQVTRESVDPSNTQTDVPPIQKSTSENHVGQNHTTDQTSQVSAADIRRRFAMTWGLDAKLVPLPSGDDWRRFTQALSCEIIQPASDRPNALWAAMRGHKKLSSKDGSQLGRDLRHVVPPVYEKGRRRTDILDIGRYLEFVRAGWKSKAKPPPSEPSRPELTPEEKKKAADNARRVREALKS